MQAGNTGHTSRGRWWGMLAVAVAAGAGLAGCRKQPAAEPAQQQTRRAKPVIYTTFYVTTYFTKRIADGTCEVVNPCPPDADPSFWVPDDATVGKYQSADLIILNGASYEHGMDKVTLPRSRVVDTARPFKDEFITLKHAFTHSHGPGGKHSHKGIDGHTWLDPINAKRQAETIRNALAKHWPEHKETFEKGYAALARDFDALDARLKALSAKLGDEILLCSHPAYNYIGRRYGWNEQTYGLDPETMPDEDTFKKIEAYLAEHPAHIMLWEAQPAPEIARRMAELGLMNVVFSPCEALSPEEQARGIDFFAVMNANIDRLEAALDKLEAQSKPG